MGRHFGEDFICRHQCAERGISWHLGVYYSLGDYALASRWNLVSFSGLSEDDFYNWMDDFSNWTRNPVGLLSGEMW